MIAGTTMPLQAVTSVPVLDPEGRLWSGAHVIPGLYVLESNGLTTGYVLEWFAGLLYCEHRQPLHALLAEARLAPPGGSGVFSTLGAALFDARTIGIPVGNLSLSHMATPSDHEGRRNVSRAVLEGIAYSARANMEQIEVVLGGKVENVLVAGGLSRSSLWTGILSDVLGRPVSVAATPEVSVWERLSVPGWERACLKTTLKGRVPWTFLGEATCPGRTARNTKASTRAGGRLAPCVPPAMPTFPGSWPPTC
ncbi:MAG: FGGY-family carbohydrate kinase [Actinomycetota bacterium]